MNKAGIFALSLLTVPVINNCNRSDTDQHRHTKKPNIIIFLSDDQGYGDFGITGNTQLQTPNIDQLAEHGAMFTRFYVAPVCSPTRAEMLTGRYHPRSGVTRTSRGGERLSLDQTLLSEVFKDAGYETALFGKWHNGTQFPYHPNARGFNEFYGFTSGHWGNYFSPPMDHNGQMVEGKGYMTDDITHRAIDFIHHKKNNPFFIILSLNTPHSPMQVPDEYWNRFSNKEMELRGTLPQQEDIEHTRAALAMIENIDWNVGRVMHTLGELDLEDNTMVLFFNDNGPNGHRWNAGLKGIKGSVDEGGVRSPLFFQWKGKIPGNHKIETIAGAIDLFPTLAELAGIPNDIDFDGLSLAPLLIDHETVIHWPDRMIFSRWFNRTSVRNQQYFYSTSGDLFDLLNDPNQTTDISQSKPELAKGFDKQIQEWKQMVFTGLDNEHLPFTVGHPLAINTLLPARDANATGGIARSSRHPNDSFFTQWKNTDDEIIWHVEILQEGHYLAEIYYTCAPADVGVVIELSSDSSSIQTTIDTPHDPPLSGMEHDRVLREESYVKDFALHTAGKIYLDPSVNQLKLSAMEIPGLYAIDMKALILTKVKK